MELYLIGLIVLFFSFVVAITMYFVERNKGITSRKQLRTIAEIDKKINNHNAKIDIQKSAIALDQSDIIYVGWGETSEI